jgi:uncharacterized protein (TIGR03382 family)
LAVDPQDPSLVYAATFHSGLYRSTDGGLSWSQVGGGLPTNRSITTVDIDPHDSRSVYAGRNEAGLYHSADGGLTWRQMSAGLPAEGVITDVEFDPLDAQVLYAAEVFSGIYRTQDGGRTWQVINGGLGVRSVNALAISKDGLHLYAASEGAGVLRLDLNGRPPEPAPEPERRVTATALPAAVAGSQPTSAPNLTSPAAPTAVEGTGRGICGTAAAPILVLVVGWLFRRRAR